MAETRKIVRVFLASPGDLQDERKAAKAVVDEFNELLARKLGHHVELVGWEDTVSAFGRPQAIINQDLEQCELFIGLMWMKWGTPPAASGLYTSGFEEEFRLSLDRRMREGRPEISVLFKKIEPEFLNDPGDGLKKVLHFKTQLITEKQLYFEHFSSIRDFEAKIRRRIVSYVLSLQETGHEEVSDQGRSRTKTQVGGQSIDGARTSRDGPWHPGKQVPTRASVED
jgi:hypothetical protein